MAQFIESDEIKIIEELMLKRLLGSFRNQLNHDGIVEISKCLNKETLQMVISETIRVFEKKAERRDFNMKSLDNTPRHLFNVNENKINEESNFLMNFYYSKDMLYLVGLIGCEYVDYIPFAGDRYLINGLTRKNDTHGWHWDDYAYALIVIAESPPRAEGGLVETVPHTEWDRENPNIQKTLAENKIATNWFPSGSVYLMRSDTTLHRVTEITGNKRRIVFVTGYSNDADLLKKMDHQTAIELMNLKK